MYHLSVWKVTQTINAKMLKINSQSHGFFKCNVNLLHTHYWYLSTKIQIALLIQHSNQSQGSCGAQQMKSKTVPHRLLTSTSTSTSYWSPKFNRGEEMKIFSFLFFYLLNSADRVERKFREATCLALSKLSRSNKPSIVYGLNKPSGLFRNLFSGISL